MNYEESVAAWVFAEGYASGVSARMSSAIRDRPPYKERERFEEYQARIMAPLIEERNKARAEAKAAKQEMIKARSREGTK